MAARASTPEPGTRLVRARALYERATAENFRGRFAVASALLTRALRQLVAVRAESPDDEFSVQHPAGVGQVSTMGAEWIRIYALVWLSISTCQSAIHGSQRGVDTLDAVGPVVRSTGDVDLEAAWLDRRGWILLRDGRLAEALDVLVAATPKLAGAKAITAYSVLINRGLVRLYRGELEEAGADFRAAAELGKHTGNSLDAPIARHNCGYVEYLRGNLAYALASMPELDSMETELHRGVTLMDRSRVLIEAGLVDEAGRSLAEAAALFQQGRLWPDLAEAELARAECALIDGEAAAALRFADRAFRRFRSRHNTTSSHVAQLVRLQARIRVSRATASQVREATTLAEHFAAQRSPAHARKATLIAADAALRLGHIQQARQFVRAAGAPRSTDPITVRLHIRLLHAKIADAEGSTRTARAHIRRGVGELAQYQASFGGIDLQTASALHGRALAELDLALAMREGRPGVLFSCLERSRAISARTAPIYAPADEQLGALFAELRRLTHEQRDEESAGRVPAADLVSRIGRLQHQLRARSWEVRGTGTALAPISLPQVRLALEAQGASMVNYFHHGGRLCALVVTGKRSRLVDLGSVVQVEELCSRVRADIDVLALPQLNANMNHTLVRSTLRTLRLLEMVLLRPLHLPPGRPLVVVPTGVLFALPWNAFPALRGRPVVVAPSAHIWRQGLSGRVSTATGATVAVLAGPSLAYANQEVTAVAAQWASATAVPEANHADLVHALATASVVHVAAHGRHQSRNPLFSSLQLADGNLFAYELERHGWTSEHVVLSACELGRATLRPGNEALGLTSVLLRLGARCVVSGVSRVRDELSAQVMLAYHRRLSGGMDSAGALAAACAEFPTELVPFVCFGSPWRATAPSVGATVVAGAPARLE